MRTCTYAGKSTFLTGTHAFSVSNCYFLAKHDEGAEITVGPKLGALTLIRTYGVKYTSTNSLVLMYNSSNFSNFHSEPSLNSLHNTEVY